MMKKAALTLGITFCSFITWAQPTLEWSRQSGGLQEDRTAVIKTDQQGNVYTTGSFLGTVDFDPGSAVVERTATTSVDGDQKFITKFDASGKFIWVKTFEVVFGNPIKIALDVNGNLYATANFRNSLSYPAEIGTVTIASVNLDDAFILKLNALGNFVWLKQIQGQSYQYADDIVIDKADNLLIAGCFGQTADFDPGDGIVPKTSGGNLDAYILSLSLDGEFQWVKTFGGISYEAISKITTDAAGNIYAVGNFRGTTDLDPSINQYTENSIGSYDIFISKFNAVGELVWGKAIGSVEEDNARSVVVDASGNIYTACYFQESIDVNPGIDIETFTSAGIYDILILKLNASGEYIWAQRSGNTLADYPLSLDIDKEGDIYLSGVFQQTISIGKDATSSLTSAGNGDGFIAKLTSNGALDWVKQVGGTGSDYLFAALDKDGNVFCTGAFENTVNVNTLNSPVVLTSNGGRDIQLFKLNQGPILGVEERTELIKEINIFPNPAHSEVVILFPSSVQGATIDMYNLSGYLVQKVSNVSGARVVFDISSIEAGVYIVEIYEKEIVSRLRLIKQ